MSFLDTLEGNLNKKARTQNGAISNDSSLDYVLDFFASAGAMRGKQSEAYALFEKAYAQDKNLALKTLFYLRDVRGGQGERSVFNYIYNQLENDVKNKLAIYVPEYGRWDEFPISKDTIHVIEHQLADDERAMSENRQVSLLAKWLPSESTSSKETIKKAKDVIRLLGIKPSQYRKRISKLRSYIRLLETDMTNKNWSDINYSKIPSQAHKKHIKAFFRNDESRYKKYLENVQKGEEKINSGTLFTYQIFDMVSRGDNKAADALWKGLPDWTRGNNSLVVADVSGSMNSGNSNVRPISVSVSLALYFAERNKGLFKDYFMTFSLNPKLQRVVGDTLSERMSCINRANWDMNTNVQAMFDEILKAALNSNASQDEIPKTLYIISDMQFDAGWINGAEETNFEIAKKKFQSHGYDLPHIVFWNVNAYGDQPATKFDKNVTLISGFSQSTFQYAVEGKTPLESMVDILNSERYRQISIE